jgi:hypothetical protein
VDPVDFGSGSGTLEEGSLTGEELNWFLPILSKHKEERKTSFFLFLLFLRVFVYLSQLLRGEI